MKINRNSLIGEVITEHPETMEVFERYGLPCAHCLALEIESLEVGARRHDLDVNKLINELNKVIEREATSNP